MKETPRAVPAFGHISALDQQLMINRLDRHRKTMNLYPNGKTDIQEGENVTGDSNFQVTPGPRPRRERVGLVVDGSNAASAVKTIVSAEDSGVRQVWTTNSPFWPDPLTAFAAAAAKTSTICMGTSIVPTYPRHPLVLAQQALALHDLAPGRLRLGIGPSHRLIMEGTYGLQQTAPLAHLSEYVKVLRAALWEGKVDHHGQFYSVVATLPRTAQVPVLVSALGEKAFQLAGKVSDGALSWVCPVPYLLRTGIPALRASASAAGRAAAPPPLVAHVPVALSEDRDSVLAAGHQMLDFYATLPFYANMFTNAGLPPIPCQQAVSDDLVESLVVSGIEATVAARLTELLAAGVDELMVSLVPTAGAGGRDDDDDVEHARLAHLIGRL
jgi:F420-dependent oxidoreductase-like protein